MSQADDKWKAVQIKIPPYIYEKVKEEARQQHRTIPSFLVMLLREIYGEL